MRPYPAVLCFALTVWHKLGKIAQCLFFRVVVVVIYLFVLANLVLNCSLWRFSYLQLIMVRLTGGGGILCRHAHSLYGCVPVYMSWRCQWLRYEI